MHPSTVRCDACDATMSVGLHSWHLVCGSCGLERSTLRAQINELDSIDEEAREAALKPIRDENFDTLLSWLNESVPTLGRSGTRRKLLDVGCAHGWFLEKAALHYEVLGLEPDDVVARRTLQRNLPVRNGYFPQALEAREKFDVIVFNDVLEHIPDVKTVLKECAAHLQDGGVVVVNAPDSHGLFYRLSKLFVKTGRTGTFDRMWQVGLPSPHLYYFDSLSLGKIAAASGYGVIATRPLSSVGAKGLYERIRYAGDASTLRAVLMTLGVLMAIPILRLFPADIRVWVLKKQPA